MSEHAAPALKPPDDPAFTLPASLAGMSVPLCAGGLVALLAGFAVGNFQVGRSFQILSQQAQQRRAGYQQQAVTSSFIMCGLHMVGDLFCKAQGLMFGGLNG